MADDEGNSEPALKTHRWEAASSANVPTTSRWGSGTPRQLGGDTPKVIVNTELSAWRGHATPTPSAYTLDSVKTPSMRNRGGVTPIPGGQTPTFGGGGGGGGQTPTFGGQTPTFGGQTPTFGGQTPAIGGVTPMFNGTTPMFTGATPAAGMAFGVTPNYQFEGTTPVQSRFAGSDTQSAITANIEAHARKLEMQWRMKNKRLTEEYLDSILPPEFKVVEPPADYNPLPPEEPNFYELASKSLDVFVVNQSSDTAASVTYDIPESLGEGMPEMKPEDAPVFEVLLKYHNVNPIPDEVLPSYLLMKNLFKIKNGDSAQRRTAMRFLLDKARVFGSEPLFRFTFHVWRSGILDLQEQHYYVDLVKGAISRLQKEVRSSTKEIVHMMEVLLSAQESVVREDGKEVLILLTRVVGYEAAFEAIKEDFAHVENGTHFQRMVIDTVRRVVMAVGTVGVPDTHVALLLDGAIAAVKQDESGLNRVVLEGLATICNSLGKRLKRYLRQVFDLIKSRRDMLGMIRMQAAELVSRIAHTVKEAGGTLFLQDLGRSLFDRLEDDEAAVMSANLKATRAILTELGSAKYHPSVRELLKKLTYIISNRNSNVQLSTILLIEEIATNCDEDVEAIHLQELATKGLFELLDAHRRETRRACIRTFGVIAHKIRPFAIILELVDNFKQDKRKIRICTAVALGAIARECGAFTVIPYLLNESKMCEGELVATIVQHSILKAVRYIFEAIGPAGKDFVYPLVPLLVRALTESEIQHRRMAVEACRAIVLTVAGFDGFEDLVIHFLNFIHPNIVELLSRNETKISEERLKMVTAVVGYYEAARLVVGSGRMFQYLLQGLFHPAKKVRDIYRRSYNMMYVASPEALVPHYPRVNDDDEHTYVRHELEVLL
uniref:Putative splicing factor 3B subunit 1 n=1 Tax=Trypanosoma vivax (strain Y486) TaxID=1055687 RepID=G0UD91_TRYVY|nr:putative splicing factor 3B subunit 1, fragment [Trypanosoma vivax Y486]